MTLGFHREVKATLNPNQEGVWLDGKGPLYPCDRCESMVKGDNSKQLDGGLWLIVYDYYGGFSDDFEDAPVGVALCHDCAVSLAREVPKVAALGEPYGGHPWTHLDPCEPCCEFSWPMCGCSDCWDVHVQPCEIIRKELL